jgi:HD-GYP domain-containing protein (c-di-GMP phosphodiesterase class II)
MYHDISINLLNLVLSLSDALDLSDSSLFQRQIRSAFVAWELGRAACLPPEALKNLFIAALFHELGALSPDEKVTLYRGQAENPDGHCVRGERLLQTVPIFEPCAKIVRCHHRSWRDWNEPIENQLVLQSQILLLADTLEGFIKREQYILHQNDDLIFRVSSLSGNQIHPLVIDLLKYVGQNEAFWLDITSPRLYSLLLHSAPGRGTEVELGQLLIISEFVRNLIDFRSKFTVTHSAGVSTAASMIATLFGLTELESELMKVAGNLHDLGKVAIPNSILEKDSPLTDEEFAVMRQHTYVTYMVLNSIGGIQQITEWAAFHHERLDGSGYPFHLTSKKLGIGSRIVSVADVFTALAEDRPYRKGMNKNDVMPILKDLGNKRLLDIRIIELLHANYEQIHWATSEAQEKAMCTYLQIY